MAERVCEPGPVGSTCTTAGAVIAWFCHITRADVATVDDKGANLGELTSAGFAVPAGFVETADAYVCAIKDAGVRAELGRRAAAIDADDPAELAWGAEECRRMVRSSGMPASVRAAVIAADGRLGRCEHVAVRSSATSEDTASTSFAGMNDSFTNVTGPDELVARIVDGWASLWSPPVVAYRATQDLTSEPAIAVVVQPMVDAIASVSVNPDAAVAARRAIARAGQRMLLDSARGR